MKMKRSGWFKVIWFASAISVLAACDDDDSSEPMGKGEAEFEITDAPSDDASVKGVFVTIADIKVDGQSVSGFTKQTIDLKAYQEGNTKLLAKAGELDAKSYNKLTLVLDLNADANGNAPGCYVLTQDDTKYKLRNTTTGLAEVTINKDWSVVANTTSKIVMDFDLRKSLEYSDDPAIRYSFVSDDKLGTSIRLVAREDAGTIKGSYQGGSDADKIVVYAYKKGTFSAATETESQDENATLFANAVTSAEVRQGVTGRTFTLAFLEEGEYELHFAEHRQDASGRMTFEALLNSETTIDGSAANVVKVNGGVTVNVSGTLGLL